MSTKQNINFESYIPADKINNLNKPNKKIFFNLIKKTQKEVKEKRNVFHSFSKNFKLNLELEH